MKEIKLSNYNKFILVDDEDYYRTSQHGWCIQNFEKISIAATINSKHTLIANFILKVEGTIDHRDRNSFNNQKENLRKCTKTQNKVNCFMANNTSGYKGVCWHIRSEKWIANIKVKKQRIHLGYFNDPKDAARAYNNAALEYYGEFAYLNIIEN